MDIVSYFVHCSSMAGERSDRAVFEQIGDVEQFLEW